MNKKLLLLPLALVLLALPGCAGYHLGGIKPARLASVERLAIPTFKNLTLEPRLGSLVTNAVIKQVQLNGGYKISNADQADATLNGTVTTVARSQFRSDPNNVLRTSQLAITLTVTYQIQDGSGVLLHQGQASANSYVILDTNIQNSEAQALEDAAQRLAVTLASEITDGW